MKHITILVLAFAAACGNGDGGSASVSSHSDAADQAVKAMNEFGGILDKVTDKASAESAKPKLEALAKRLDGLVTAVEKLGLQEGDAKVEEKMQAGLESLSPKVLAYLDRITSTPGLAAVLEGPYLAVNQKLAELRGMLGG